MDWEKHEQNGITCIRNEKMDMNSFYTETNEFIQHFIEEDTLPKLYIILFWH